MSRITVLERDFSGFINTTMDETGGMVVKSQKGRKTPMYIQSEVDALRELGNPSAEYPGVFEVISFTRQAPCWVVSAIGKDALYGGVDITENGVIGFGTGRDWDTFTYGPVQRKATQFIGGGNGIVVNFEGVLTNVPITGVESFQIVVNNVIKDMILDSSGNISGADGSGTVDLETGEFEITFTGTPGVAATITSDVDGSGGFDLSVDDTDKYIKITIDNMVKTINLGQSDVATLAEIVDVINTEFNNEVAEEDGQFITISGQIGSNIGVVKIETPDVVESISLPSALNIVFTTNIILENYGIAPTGAVPKYMEGLKINYIWEQDISTIASHSFFTTSPYNDDLAIMVTHVEEEKVETELGSGIWVNPSKLSDLRFNMMIYRVQKVGNSPLASYTYSLIKEKDAFGRSLYWQDVFMENPYIQMMVNSNFVSPAVWNLQPIQVLFTGGTRGEEPETGDYTEAWNQFRFGNKYRVKIFMDVYGHSAHTLNNLIQTYQQHAQGITVIPLGYSPSRAITFRKGLAIDTDDIGIYHNWAKIRDDYNNSSAWISNIGSVGKKFALMEDVFDAGSPAGIDENSHGGLLSDWQIIEVENDYTQAELDAFYNAQINPIVLDDSYGFMIYGDQTLQVTNSDTSFVGTRRVYKYILDVVSKQILRKQEFKLNDPLHRLMARIQTEDFISPIRADGWIRDYKVVCDETNNTDIVLNNREFLLDLYIRITPNSQWITLRLTRLPQGQITIGGITV